MSGKLDDAAKEGQEKEDKDKQFKEELKKDISTLYQETLTADNKNLVSYISIGNKLLSARKRLGFNFYQTIDEDVIPTKQVQRYIKLVLTTDSEEKFKSLKTMDQTKVDALKADSNILGITEEQLNAKNDKGKHKFKDPSMAKLMIMKHLSPDEFNGVVKGEPAAETAYENKKTKLADNKKASSEKQAVNKHKPEGMEEKDFKTLLNDGIYELIKKYHNVSGKDAVISVEDKEELKNLRDVTAKQKKDIAELERRVNVYKKLVDKNIEDVVFEKEEDIKKLYKSYNKKHSSNEASQPL